MKQTKQMNGHRSKLRRSAWLSLMLSNLLILLVPIMLGFLLYIKVESSVKSNTERYNSAMLEQLRLSMESNMNGMNLLAEQVTLNPKLNYLLNIKSMNENEKSDFIDLVRNYLEHYRKMTGSFVNMFYIYLPNSDTILSPGVMSSPSIFYEAYLENAGLQYEEWIALLNSRGNKAFIPLPGNGLAYVQSLPLLETVDVKGTFIIMLDQMQIKEMFRQIEAVNESAIYILDRNHKIIVGTGDELPEELLGKLLRKLDQKQGLFENYINGTISMVSYTSSEKYGLTYVSVMPQDTFLQWVNQIKTWAIIILAVSLIIGVTAVVSATYRGYNPLRRLALIIKQSSKQERSPFDNEFDYIRKALEGSMYKEQELKSMLDRQLPVIRANLLSRLFRGYMEGEREEKLKALQFAGVEFVSQRFAVIYVYTEDIAQFSHGQNEHQWAFSQFIITNISEELINERHRGFAAEIDRDRLAILVNFRAHREESSDQGGSNPDERQRLDEHEELKTIVGSLKQLIAERFKMSVTIAVSNSYTGIERIEDCFMEAENALDYTLVKGKSSIIFYKEEAKFTGNYYYPLEMEVRLVNFVKSGDKENTAKLLDEIYTKNFIVNPISPERGKMLFFNIMSTYLKVKNNINNFAEEDETDFDPAVQLLKLQTAGEMHQAALKQFNRLASSFQTETTDRGLQKFEEMVRLIGNNLSSTELGLPFIADYFQVTPQYVSSFFKKYSGSNFADYIARLRIDHAKRLLVETSYTNAQIAEGVGYSSTVVFIRVFKKLEGVTPGIYRESHLNNEGEVNVR